MAGAFRERSRVWLGFVLAKRTRLSFGLGSFWQKRTSLRLASVRFGQNLSSVLCHPSSGFRQRSAGRIFSGAGRAVVFEEIPSPPSEGSRAPKGARVLRHPLVPLERHARDACSF